MKPIVMLAPAYANCSAGIRACYRLVDDILALGWPARVELADNPGRALPGEVAIYPEIYGGNPLQADHVCRWLLGPQKMEPDPGDLVFAWPGAAPFSVPRLCVNVIELDLFKPKTAAGHGVVGWVGKGVPNGDFAPEWISYGSPATRAGVAALLSGAELLVSCDGFSSLNLEATLVGTPVRLYADPLAAPPPFPSFGFAYSDAEMPEAAASLRGGAAYLYYRDVTLPAVADDVPNMLAAVEEAFG